MIHRITNNSGWKGLQDVIKFSLLLIAEPSLRSDLVTQDLVKSDLENLQGQRLHSLSSQPVSLLGCPPEEKVVPHMQSKPLISTFSRCLSSRTTVKRLAPSP